MIECCADVLMAEALALRFGLLMGQKAGCNRLIINSDNMEVIDTMKTKDILQERWLLSLRIAFFGLLIFQLQLSNIVIEKRTR